MNRKSVPVLFLCEECDRDKMASVQSERSHNSKPRRGDISVAHDASRGLSARKESKALEEGGIISTDVRGELAMYVAPTGALI